MTEAIDHREYNKFSNKSKNLIKKVQQLTVNATQLIPQLYDSLKEDGIPPLEARTYIEEIVVISQRQLRRILPDEAKYTEKLRNNLRTYVRKSENPEPNRRLVVPEEPTIPPPPEVHREAEIVKEPDSEAKFQEKINALGSERIPIRSQTIEVVFDPAIIDRDRTQVFILEIDIVTKKVKTYKTVGRRTIR
jgi:hypothetical protein